MSRSARVTPSASLRHLDPRMARLMKGNEGLADRLRGQFLDRQAALDGAWVIRQGSPHDRAAIAAVNKAVRQQPENTIIQVTGARASAARALAAETPSAATQLWKQSVERMHAAKIAASNFWTTSEPDRRWVAEREAALREYPGYREAEANIGKAVDARSRL